VQLKNKTKEKVIMMEIINADNFFTRLKGLLGKKGLPQGQCMFISPCKSVHTFFMKFPIDVVFIDKGFKVVKVIKNMVPGRTSPYVKEAWAVIEMSVDAELECKLAVADELQLI
jgi:uncharacterized membrane protein (UPF0127 family)